MNNVGYLNNLKTHTAHLKQIPDSESIAIASAEGGRRRSALPGRSSDGGIPALWDTDNASP